MVKEIANKDAVKAVAEVKPVEAAKKEEVKKAAAPKAAAAKKAPAAKKAAAKKAPAKKAAAKKTAKKAPAKKLGKLILEIDGQQIDIKAVEKKAAKLGGDVYIVAAEKKLFDTNGKGVDLF